MTTNPGSSARPAPPEGHRSAEVPYALRLTSAYLWRILLVMLSVYVLLRVMNYFTSLVVPLLIAVLVAALVNPAVEFFSRWLPRPLVAILTVLATVGLVAGLFTVVGTQIRNEMSELTAQALKGFAQLQNWLANGPLHLGSADLNKYVEQGIDQLQANAGRVASQALTYTATAGEALTGLVLVLFTLIFLLMDGRRIWSWVLLFVPRAGRERADAAGQAGWLSLTAYVRATILVALVDALGIGIGAAILGVPLAIPLGVLVFIGAFIPIVGALVSGAVAVLVALVMLGFVKALIMLAIVIGVQQLESHILQPFLMGRMVEIHPLGVVFAIGAGIVVDGITGALFAVPLVAVLNTVGHVLASPDSHAAAQRILDHDDAGTLEDNVPEPAETPGNPAER